MGIFNGRGLVAAMEDEVANRELAIDEAGADSMEASLVETVDMAADIEAGTSEMQQTIADADQLERHVEVLQDAEGEGGADARTIEATEIAVESIFQRMGIYGGTGIPAMESFSTSAGRARSTRVAIESITDKLKKVWEAVVLAFKKMINYVKDFFGQVFETNKRLLGRVNSLRQKVKNLKGKPGEKIKSSGITDILGSGDTEKVIKEIGIKESTSTALVIHKPAPDFLKGVKSQADFESVVLDKPLGTESKKISAPEGYAWFVVSTIGLSEIIRLGPNSSKKGKAAYEAATKTTVKTNQLEKSSDGELKAMDATAMGRVLDAVEGRVKELIGSKAAIEKINSELEQTIASINALVSQSSKDDADVNSRSTVTRSAVTAVSNASVAVVTSTAKETTRCCSAALTYVERSIDSYTEEEKKKD